MKKFFSLLVLLSAWTSLVQAQITFSKEYGGFYDEDGRWMEQTSDSGFVMVGGTETYSNGQSDIWLVRTDAYGNVLWNRSYGDTQFDFANMVRITSDGGFVIAGFTGSFGAVNNDGWIIKTDGSGNIQWTRMIGDNGIQEIEAIIQTTDGVMPPWVIIKAPEHNGTTCGSSASMRTERCVGRRTSADKATRSATHCNKRRTEDSS